LRKGKQQTILNFALFQNGSIRCLNTWYDKK